MSTLVAPPRNAKATLLVCFVLVFFCGSVCGALLTNMWSHHTAINRAALRGHFAGQFELQHLQRELDLDAEQSRQLSMILDDVAKYYDNVLSDGQTRVMQILNEQQKAKFEKMLAEEAH
jgi:hypothetical protein